MLVNKCDSRNYFFVIKYKKVMLSKKIISVMVPMLMVLNVWMFCYFSFPAIGRTLIPRYFRSIFEGGVTDLYYILKHAKESFHTTSITLDCEVATMVTHHGKPMFTKVRIVMLEARERVGSGKELVRGKSWFRERVGSGKELVQGKSCWFRERIGSGRVGSGK